MFFTQAWWPELIPGAHVVEERGLLKVIFRSHIHNKKINVNFKNQNSNQNIRMLFYWNVNVMQVIMEHLDALHSFVQNFTLFRMRKGLKLSKKLNSVNLFLLQRKLFVMVFCSALRSDRAGVRVGAAWGGCCKLNSGRASTESSLPPNFLWLWMWNLLHSREHSREKARVRCAMLEYYGCQSKWIVASR